MNPEIVACIMAGGTGTRFWPMSTEHRPKQFLKLFGERTLLQQSFDRLENVVAPDHILILTNQTFVPLVHEQLPKVPEENIIAEPMRKDTAAAIALAALVCQKKFGNPVMVVLTSDHIIHPQELFQKAVRFAIQHAWQQDKIVTFGIVPDYPATGFGYLQAGEKSISLEGIDYFPLLKFHEKPSLATAESYLKTGTFYWNSGMFVWQVNAILEQIQHFLPQHDAVLKKAIASYGTQDWQRILTHAFADLTAVSIDIAVMQKIPHLCVGVVAQFYWSDVGGWLALEQYLQHDSCQNAVQGQLVALNSSGNIVFAENPQETIALIGVENLIVVRSGSNTLIVPKDQAEKIKELVAKL